MPKRTTIGSWFEDLVSLCFPDLCVCCNNNLYRGETLICMKCLHRLPKNDMHYEKGKQLPEEIAVVFAGGCLGANTVVCCSSQSSLSSEMFIFSP